VKKAALYGEAEKTKGKNVNLIDQKTAAYNREHQYTLQYTKAGRRLNSYLAANVDTNESLYY
jgi:hypothetical protein